MKVHVYVVSEEWGAPFHTRETVNLYSAGAPRKEKLTVSGVGVVWSNQRFVLYPSVFAVS